LAEKLDDIIQETGGTRVGRAITGAVTEFQSNGRNDVAKIMVIVTDGDTNNREEERSQAARY